MSNYKNEAIITNSKGEWRLGAVMLWNDYDAYVRLTKERQQICFEISNPKWMKHFNYMTYHQKT